MSSSGYLNNRHYDPTTGVFTSVDPLVASTMQPYIYGAANPVTFSDPSGLEACDVESGVCWDDYEDTERGSVYQRFRFVYRLLGIKPTTEYDEESNTTRFENIPAPLQTELSENAAITWDVGMTTASGGSSSLSLVSGTQSHEDGGFDLAGGWAVSATACLFPCISIGIHNWRPYVTVGEMGLGASVDAHVTNKGSCDQAGWSQGASVVPGLGGGVSVGSSVSDGGGWWTVDGSNWDASVSAGVRAPLPFTLPASGGTAHTWMFGC